MPLDQINGEVLDGLPVTRHIPIPARLLADLSNLRTEYTPPTTKFVHARMRKATRPVFDDAVANAIAAFAAKGALRPIRFDEDDVLVQVYPHDFKVAVIFQRKIAGQVHYATSYYDLPKPVLDTLLQGAGRIVRTH